MPSWVVADWQATSAGTSHHACFDTADLLLQARGMGLGDNDFSAVMEAVAKQAPKQ